MELKIENLPEKYQNSFCLEKIKRIFEGNEREGLITKIRPAENGNLVIISKPKAVQIRKGSPTLQYYDKNVFQYDNQENLIVRVDSLSIQLTDIDGKQMAKPKGNLYDDNAKMYVRRKIRVWNKDHVEISRTNFENQSKAQAEGIITARVVDDKLENFAKVAELEHHIAEINHLLPQTDDYGQTTYRQGDLAEWVTDECLYTRMERDPKNAEKVFCQGCIMTINGTKKNVQTVAHANMEHPEQTEMRVDERVFDELFSEYQEDMNKQNEEMTHRSR